MCGAVALRGDWHAYCPAVPRESLSSKSYETAGKGTAVKFLERFWFSCGHCQECHCCPVTEAAENGQLELGPLSKGLPLVVSASAVFLLPLTLAILLAWLFGSGAQLLESVHPALAQAAGAVVGFLAGVGLAKLIVTVVLRMCETTEDPGS